ncbi:phosphatase PAP2 family protein [Paenibacillus radicis (ex Gao et al. 2016)]|uniref:Phosphatase PAP2 family protein n=1 Tax=Paenibacillus radicis (ex Gao et al. 2016) TaxID=1737354 RepID=A0A917HFL6_9BACL|nr:phosphatase PAP2 family protein [Paenibacillus radicis (ex Gao et al. 2016)]GGG77026.1 phosphatase PAP2 family protein [Paenibacillus radicis (ex Gao et al. 2016)]
MRRMIEWLRTREQEFIVWANQRRVHRRLHRWLGKWLSTVTHMGGASFTVLSSLLFALLAPAPWNTTGWHCFTAVVISHFPVFIVKRKFKRLRPYQALEGMNTGRKPLVDSSFPSGHTTAIFAWLIPLVAASGPWFVIALPVAVIIGVSVGWSRMYLGLHYPSDVAVGALIGTLTAIAVEYNWVTPV